MEKHKVLVVDDEWNMRNLVKIHLRKQGFEVTEASGGIEAVRLTDAQPFDLMILDIMMPNMDGWQVCQNIRKKHNLPILMLTARADIKDKVKGLNIGADDYLVKPFEPEELIARVSALIRRNTLAILSEEDIVSRENIKIYADGREVRINDQKVDFTPKEFDLLYLLAKHPKRAFTRDMLLEHVWGLDFFGDARTVDSHVKNIREKAENAGLHYSPIQTVWGVGYKFQEGR